HNSPVHRAGSLYVCAGSTPTLYQVILESGAFISQTPNSHALAGGAATCSPVTEYLDTAGTPTDYIFFGVTANGNWTACYGGCVYSLIVTFGTIGSGTSPTAAVGTVGGNSGIIID